MGAVYHKRWMLYGVTSAGVREPYIAPVDFQRGSKIRYEAADWDNAREETRDQPLSASA